MVQRILVIKMSSLGDIIHALPAVSALRQRFPHSRLTWLVKEVWAPILEGNPDIDEIVVVKTPWRNWVDVLRTIRRGRFDMVVDFQGLFRSGALGALTGAKTRVGFAAAREGAPWFYTHQVPLPGDKSFAWRLLKVHAVDRNLAITQSFGGDCSTPVFHLPQLPEDRIVIERLLQQAGVTPHEHLIAVAPWTRSPLKAWPQQHFLELSMKLLQRPNVRVVLVGGTSDIGSAEAFHVLTAQGLINLVGKVSLRQLPLLLKHMQLLVGNDSAPLHLAAGVGIPVLAIHGPTHPSVTGPYPLGKHVIVRTDLPCSPCGKGRCGNPEYLQCLQAIPVDRLLDEIERMRQREAIGKEGKLPCAEQYSGC